MGIALERQGLNYEGSYKHAKIFDFYLEGNERSLNCVK